MTSVDAVGQSWHDGGRGFTEAGGRGPHMPSEKGFFALRLRELRLSAGLSQPELAERYVRAAAEPPRQTA